AEPQDLAVRREKLNWLLLNRLFLSKKTKARFIRIGGGSLPLPAILSVYKYVPAQVRGTGLATAALCYVGFLSFYFLSRLTHHLLCPEPLADVLNQEDFFAKRSRVVDQASRYIAKTRKPAEAQIKQLLIAAGYTAGDSADITKVM